MTFLATAGKTAQVTGIAFGSMMFGAVSDQISPDTHVSLGVAVAVGAVVVGGAWWLSARLQRIDDRLDDIEVGMGIKSSKKSAD